MTTENFTDNTSVNIDTEHLLVKNLKIYDDTKKLIEKHREIANELFLINQKSDALKQAILTAYKQIEIWSKTDSIDGQEQADLFKKEYANLNYDLGKLNDQAFSMIDKMKKLENAFRSPGIDLTYNAENSELQANKVIRAPVVLENLTEQQKTALTPKSGRIIYNTTIDKVQVFVKNIWIDLH